MMTDTQTLINIIKKDINQLNQCNIDELKAAWKALLKRRQFLHIKVFIIRDIAHFLQSQSCGVLDKKVEHLFATAQLQYRNQHQLESNHKKLLSSSGTTTTQLPSQKTKPKVSNQLTDGTVLKRYFNGRWYEVLVKVDNNKTQFIFNDEVYNSLSRIACHITGTHCLGIYWEGT